MDLFRDIEIYEGKCITKMQNRLNTFKTAFQSIGNINSNQDTIIDPDFDMEIKTVARNIIKKGNKNIILDDKENKDPVINCFNQDSLKLFSSNYSNNDKYNQIKNQLIESIKYKLKQTIHSHLNQSRKNLEYNFKSINVSSESTKYHLESKIKKSVSAKRKVQIDLKNNANSSRNKIDFSEDSLNKISLLEKENDHDDNQSHHIVQSMRPFTASRIMKFNNKKFFVNPISTNNILIPYSNQVEDINKRKQIIIHKRNKDLSSNSIAKNYDKFTKQINNSQTKISSSKSIRDKHIAINKQALKNKFFEAEKKAINCDLTLNKFAVNDVDYFNVNKFKNQKTMKYNVKNKLGNNMDANFNKFNQMTNKEFFKRRDNSSNYKNVRIIKGL